jgi:hypothetical protein
MKSLTFLAGLVALLCVSAVAPASAATIDYSPLVNSALELTNAVLVPLVLYGITLLAKKLKMDRILAVVAMNGQLHDTIQRGVDSLEGAVRERAFKNGAATVDIESDAVATVANRTIALSPDLLKNLGVTEAVLRKLVAEKLGPVAA